ncbi:MAG: hypothetical protein J5828_02460 [Desulfovibrionaceae bacterium]|nr:hypothetical protein [Desulfovibrionaceae bacterium]
MGSFFDFDTPEKKRKGLAWAFALWLFCSTNVGLIPLATHCRRSLFSFSLGTIHTFLKTLNDPAALVCWIWIAIYGLIVHSFLKNNGKKSKLYFVLLLLLSSLFNIFHFWILDIALIILGKHFYEVLLSIPGYWILLLCVYWL